MHSSSHSTHLPKNLRGFSIKGETPAIDNGMLHLPFVLHTHRPGGTQSKGKKGYDCPQNDVAHKLKK